MPPPGAQVGLQLGRGTAQRPEVGVRGQRQPDDAPADVARGLSPRLTSTPASRTPSASRRPSTAPGDSCARSVSGTASCSAAAHGTAVRQCARGEYRSGLRVVEVAVQRAKRAQQQQLEIGRLIERQLVRWPPQARLPRAANLVRIRQQSVHPVILAWRPPWVSHAP